MSRAFNPAPWTNGLTVVHKSDFQAIATDLYTRGDDVDGGGFGRANTGFLGLIPGALPGTTYTVSAASWSGGVATVTIGAHVIGVNQLVTIAGVTPSGWNVGPVRVTAVASTTFSFALAGNPGAYTSGGTVLVGSVPGTGRLAVDQNGILQVYISAGWVAATLPDIYDVGGNVGIGTNSPGAKLHVAGAAMAAASGLSADTDLMVVKDNDTNTYLVGLRFASLGGSTAALRAKYTNAGAHTGTELRFFTNPTGGNNNLQQRMVIDYQGFVGIGTGAPTSKLHVTGLPTYASNAAALAGGLTAGAIYTDGAGALKVTF